MNNLNSTEYLNHFKELYGLFIEYIDNDDDSNFSSLTHLLTNYQINENPDDIIEFLQIVDNVSCNHIRSLNFFSKIEKVLHHLSGSISQTFTNYELFNLFKHNKRILLYFLRRKQLIFDNVILDIILKSSSGPFKDYKYYFFNEIKDKIPTKEKKVIESVLKEMNPNIFDSFDIFCEQGENETYLCELIRRDSVDDFVSYLTKMSISPNRTIKRSIFETNSLLLSRDCVSLIEYAAFFDSAQIFQYLRMSKVEINHNFWSFVVHGRNPEMIHFLEENEIFKEKFELGEIFDEAIKCHHNEIADYVKDNYDVFHSIEGDEKEVEEEETESQNSSLDNEDYVDKFFSFVKNIFVKNEETEIIHPKEAPVFMQPNKSAFMYHNYHFIVANFKAVDFICMLINYNYIALSKFLAKWKSFDVDANLMDLGTPIQIAANSNNYRIVNFLLTKVKRTSLKKREFQQTNLTEIDIPNSIKSIEFCSFYKCASLRKITIPPSVTSIAKCAFYGCSSLTKLVIPPSVKMIERQTFCECESLIEVRIPSSVKSIGPFAFYGCFSLKRIDVPDSVKTISDNAFNKCTSLKFFSVPPQVTSIEAHTFNGCTSLEEIIIPPSVSSIGIHAFSSCESLKKIRIPSSVTKISDHLFYGCFSLSSIEFEDPLSITTIEKFAFARCIALKEFDIPPSVNFLGEAAFYGCRSLARISIPPTITKIEVEVFQGCNFETFTIPFWIMSIGSLSFSNSSIKEISIPSSVKFIGPSAFSECKFLAHFEVPDSITKIEDELFENCVSLTKISIPSSVVQIGKCAFCGCRSLSDVSIPPSVTEIDDCAFADCVSLVEVKIPPLLTAINVHTFEACTKLARVSMPASIQVIRAYAFANCMSLECISIPPSCVWIEVGAFTNCKSLQNVEFPENSALSTIGSSAFWRCLALKEIHFPASLKFIYSDALDGCISLKKVFIYKSTKRRFISHDFKIIDIE